MPSIRKDFRLIYERADNEDYENMTEIENYYKNCVFYFRIDGMCGRNLQCGGSIAPCLYRFNCPWFEEDPSLTLKMKNNYAQYPQDQEKAKKRDSQGA